MAKNRKKNRQQVLKSAVDTANTTASKPLENTITEVENDTPIVDMEQAEAPMRISELHLSKVHDVYNKGLQIKDIANDLYQKEFALEEARKQLDELNRDYLKEENKVSNELMQTYGDINLNIQNGEYTLKE